MPARISSKNRNSSKFIFPFVISFMVAVGILNIARYINSTPEVIAIDTTKDDYAFWENVQKTNPTYRDAYVVLARLKENEGDIAQAKNYWNEASKVDPFFIPESL